MSLPDYDAVVVGSGAGGAAAAWRLASQGVSVLLIEAGPRFDPLRDYGLFRDDWEAIPFPEGKARHRARHVFGTMQELDARWESLRSWTRGEGQLNRTGRRIGWKYHHVRGVGGSTLHFSGEAHRLNPEAMSLRTRFGVGADWPVAYRELERYYAIAESILGVSGPEGGNGRGRGTAYPLPAHRPSYASARLMAAGATIGQGWEANAVAILSQPYDGRPSCNYCANCSRGCPRGDKGSTDVTFVRKALETTRCALITDAPVLGIDAGPDGRVKAVRFMHEGRPKAARTRVLVLACGAVETPRLLLLSQGDHSPDGLANESGQVGRHFMETVFWRTSALHADNLGSYRGIASDIVCWDYNAPDAIEGVVGGMRLLAGPGESGLTGPAAYARRIVAGWGAAHKRAMREQFGRALTVSAIGESLPSGQCFVDLDPLERDEFGMPVARIHSRLADMEVRRIAFMAQRCREVLQAAGASELVQEDGTYDFFSSTHVFGTCRMGARAEDSVVDPDGRAHRWSNLYVCDASVFPSTGGGEAPSLTIEALALRSADRIRERLIAREI